MIDPFDPTTAPVGEPTTFVQNAFTHWRRSDAATDDYALRRYEYQFKRQGDTSNTARIIPVDASGYVALDAPNWPIGDYAWSLYIRRVSDDARYLMATGRLRVEPDATTGGDFRSHAEIMVAKIEGLIAGRADADVQSYTIGGRQIAKMTISELVKWRDYYRAEVNREQRADDLKNGRGANNVLRVRFV